jgi:hypothetical protein
VATVTHEVGTADTGATPNTSGAFAPATGDLLVVFCVASATTETDATCVSSLGGGFTFTQFARATWTATPNQLYAFVADQLVSDTSSQTVTCDTPDDGATGTVIHVFAIAGMSRVGLDAIRQFAVQDGGAGSSTPAPAFSVSALTGNPTLGCVGNVTNPAGLTPPTDWTEPATGDLGHANPNQGGACCYRNSGFTGTTITWGSTSASQFGAIIVELDTSVDAHSGSGAATLPLLTASGTGKRSLRGSGAAALPLATASGTGKKSRPGTGAATLPSLTGSGTGKRSLQGSGTGTLPLPSAAGTGEKSRAGTGSANLPILTASGSGKKARSGDGSATLPLLDADGTGTRGLGGSGDPELPLLTADGEGELVQPGVFSGSGAVVLPFPTAAGTGKRVLLGSGAAVLPFPTASGAGRRALLGSGDPSLPEITASGTGEGGSGAPIPPPLTGGGGRRTARKPRPAPEPEAASQDERDLMELIPILILRING